MGNTEPAPSCEGDGGLVLGQEQEEQQHQEQQQQQDGVHALHARGGRSGVRSPSLTSPT